MPYQYAHPGEFLKEMIFDELGITVTKAAKSLSVTRAALSRVLNGKAGISPDLALRLEDAGVGKAAVWIRMQASYDLWKAQSQPRPKVAILQNVNNLPL